MPAHNPRDAMREASVSDGIEGVKTRTRPERRSRANHLFPGASETSDYEFAAAMYRLAKLWRWDITNLEVKPKPSPHAPLLRAIKQSQR
jgi:hypothetical protein